MLYPRDAFPSGIGPIGLVHRINRSGRFQAVLAGIFRGPPCPAFFIAWIIHLRGYREAIPRTVENLTLSYDSQISEKLWMCLDARSIP